MLFFIDNKPNLKYYIDELQSMQNAHIAEFPPCELLFWRQNAHIAELSRRGRFFIFRKWVKR